MGKSYLSVALCIFATIFFTYASALDIHIDADEIGELEDAILVTSTNGTCPYHIRTLGDLDLTKRQHVLDLSIEPAFTHWWLIGHMGPDIVYSSNLNLHDTDIYSNEPFHEPGAELVMPAPVVINSLSEYISRRVQFRFGVMTDTHYYSEPLGIPHPLQQTDPSLDLKGNLGRMQFALNDFSVNNVAFDVLLGDMVEDHAAHPLGEPFIANGALSLNMADIGSLFDQYSFPTHLVLGNHDKSYGTNRSDLYNNLSYHWQELYDNNDYNNRMDYTFDYSNVRFIVYDNVGRLPGANRGYRSASSDTLAFLANELSKVQSGGVDEHKPVIILAHTRVDCLVSEGCNQKIDLTDGVSYQWSPSVGGTNEYYLEAYGGGDPELATVASYNHNVWLDSTGIPWESIGTLDKGQWGHGRNPADSIDFNTLYIRLSTPLEGGSWNPDNATPGYIQYKYVNMGASENFEDQKKIFEDAYNNGANIIGVLQGHYHGNRRNSENGIDYITFKSIKRAVPEAHAIVEMLYDNSLSIIGYGQQATYYSQNHYYPVNLVCGENPPASASFTDWWLAQVANNHSSHATVNRGTTKLWRFASSAQEIASLSVNIHGTVLEDAEDGMTGRWSIHDNTPGGAAITNVFDQNRQSRVIEFSGSGMENQYQMRNDDLNTFRNFKPFIIEWSMKYSEPYSISIRVQTTEGDRYLLYTASNSDDLGITESVVHHGVGVDTTDGEWHALVRDLQLDLEEAQPGVQILDIIAIYISGSGRIDDIVLRSWPPPNDFDGDGIVDNLDNCTVLANADQRDTNGDGHGNICDADFDNDCVTDFLDLSLFKAGFFTTDPLLDLDSDGIVAFLDLSIFKGLFFAPPGPSAVGSLCNP